MLSKSGRGACMSEAFVSILQCYVVAKVCVHYGSVNFFLSSETLQLTTLHYVLQLMVSYYENMVMHKRERQDALAWSQR